TRNGSYQAILSYKGTCGSGNYFGFDMMKDRSLINNVLIRISFLEKIYKMEQEKRLKLIEALLLARSYNDFSKKIKSTTSATDLISTPLYSRVRFSKIMGDLQSRYQFSRLSTNYMEFKQMNFPHHLKSTKN